jgi:hypothetical protein
MADFCRDCARRVLGVTDEQYDKCGDLNNLCEEGETVSDLCEGCGFITVDHRGSKVISPEEENEEE